MAKKQTNNKLVLAFMLVMTLLIGISIGWFSAGINKSNNNEAFRTAKNCTETGNVVYSLSPVECVEQKNVEAIDHSINSFKECAEEERKRGVAHTDTYPVQCTAEDGRVFTETTTDS